MGLDRCLCDESVRRVLALVRPPAYDQRKPFPQAPTHAFHAVDAFALPSVKQPGNLSFTSEARLVPRLINGLAWDFRKGEKALISIVALPASACRVVREASICVETALDKTSKTTKNPLERGSCVFAHLSLTQMSRIEACPQALRQILLTGHSPGQDPASIALISLR
jgi:hypothetical protein